MTQKSLEQLRRELMRRADTGFESTDDASAFFADIVASVRADDRNEIETLKDRAAYLEQEVILVRNTLDAAQHDRDNWHSRAHVLATELEMERAPRTPQCEMCLLDFRDDDIVRVVERKLVCGDCYNDLPEADHQ